MTREQIYLITEQLVVNCVSNALYNRCWDFAIYKSLLASNCNDHSPIEWTKYNQWKINHNMRATKTIAKKNNGRLTAFEIINATTTRCLIKAEFISQEQTSTTMFEYSLDAFAPDLWRFQNPLGDTILKNEQECNILFTASLSELHPAIEPLNHQHEIIIEPINYQLEIAVEVVEAETLNSETHLKFHVLKEIIDALKPCYLAKVDESEKAYFETIIGAAIFYLPTSVNHFSGYISIGAIKSYLKDGKKVRDHISPRKFVARKLLSEPSVSAEALMNDYYNSYAQFMYVAPSENSLLVNYYENHSTYDDALVALQIEKFPANQDNKFESNNELVRFLRFIEDQDINSIDLAITTALLPQFRNQ